MSDRTELKPSRLLVTGGAGFIGSHFVELALKSGHQVAVLDALTYAGHTENLEAVWKHPQFQFFKGDIADAKLVQNLLNELNVDAVFNFAAESHVDRSIDGPSQFIETNILGTYRLLMAALDLFQKKSEKDRARFRFVRVSTDEVFGTLGDSGYFTEASPYLPNSPYSASKASADHLVRAWHHTYGLPTITTHCSNNYGPRQYPEKLIPFMISCALQGKPMGVYGNGKNVRDWIHVEDHCRGVYLAFERGRPGEHFCFGGQSEKANIEVVKDLCSILDEFRPLGEGKSYHSQIQFVKDRLGHDWRYAIDDRNSVEKLGSYRRNSFGEGLRNTVKWYLENQT